MNFIWRVVWDVWPFRMRRGRNFVHNLFNLRSYGWEHCVLPNAEVGTTMKVGDRVMQVMQINSWSRNPYYKDVDVDWMDEHRQFRGRARLSDVFNLPLHSEANFISLAEKQF